jgi:hypothetical protein
MAVANFSDFPEVDNGGSRATTSGLQCGRQCHDAARLGKAQLN